MNLQDQGLHKNNGADELLVLSSTTGLNFLQLFVETLADCFEADLVTVGELILESEERIRVLAGTFDGEPLINFDYEACVTPCIEVIKSAQVRAYLSCTQEAYPNDEMFREEGIQSYVGAPLVSPTGTAIGLVQAAWRREIDQEEADNIAETMGLFLDRLSTELVTIHTMGIMSALAQGAQNTDKRDTLRMLCGQLQTALKMRVAFIAECIDEDSDHFRVLAFNRDGQTVKAAEDQVLAYRDTPCHHLMDESVFLIPKGLADAFPNQEQFQSDGLTSYLGVNLKDDDGRLIGHFALQNDREIRESILETDLFKILNSRVVAELLQFRLQKDTPPLQTGIGSQPLSVIHEIGNRLATVQKQIGTGEALPSEPISADKLQSLAQTLEEAQDLLRGLKETL